MGHESGAMKAAAAQTAFLVAATRELPPEAFHDLFSRRPSGVRAWAVRWRVDAPCMIDYATALLEWAAREPQGSDLKDSIRQKKLHLIWTVRPERTRAERQWQAELARLDRLPVSPFRTLIVDAVSKSKSDDAAWDDETNAYVRDVLAPLSADPTTESQKAFIRRAEVHYAARATRSTRLGAEPVSRPSPELIQHVHWLVKWHLRGESFRVIADGLRAAKEPDAIRVSVARVARLVGLKLTRRPGRPRKGALKSEH